MRRSRLVILSLLMLTVTAVDRMHAGKEDCQTWLNRVDPEFSGGPLLLSVPLDDEEAVLAIGCLLSAEGNVKPARFGGATRQNVSQVFPPAPVELAALYYVSYIYGDDWRHGSAVALWDHDGHINPLGSTGKAFRAYKKWFKRIRTMGIAAARADGMAPLKGTGLAWYGNQVE